MKEKIRTNRAALMTALMSGLLGGGMPFEGPSTYRNGVSRVTNPWDRVNLSKAERRGKTYEELQAIRKARWEINKYFEVEQATSE